MADTPFQYDEWPKSMLTEPAGVVSHSAALKGQSIFNELALDRTVTVNALPTMKDKSQVVDGRVVEQPRPLKLQSMVPPIEP